MSPDLRSIGPCHEIFHIPILTRDRESDRERERERDIERERDRERVRGRKYLHDVMQLSLDLSHVRYKSWLLTLPTWLPNMPGP